MGLWANESTKRKKAYKTIIIPKGIIDPNSTNVIEIPLNYETNSNLVVKAPTDSNSCFTVEPYRGEHLYNPDPLPPVPVQELHQSRFQYNSTPVQKHDFSVQTQAIEMQPLRRKPHSPLCPICARPSCKFSSDFYQTISQNKRTYISPSSHLDYLIDAKSETCYPSMGKREEVFSRIVEEKLDRILKPVLVQLTSSFLEEEEQEASYRAQRLYPTPSRSYRSTNSKNDSFLGASHKDWTQDVPNYNNSSFEYPETRHSNISKFRPEYNATPNRNFNSSHRSRKTVRTEDDKNLKKVDSRFSCSPATSCQNTQSEYEDNALDSTFATMDANRQDSFDSLLENQNCKMSKKN